MPEKPEDSATETDATSEETEQSGSEEKPKPTETVEFWKSKAREQEKRAKANADAAKRLSELEERDKTEAQKSADRIAELQQQVEAKERELLVKSVQARFAIPDEKAELYLTASDEETLVKQAEGLAEQGTKRGNHAPYEGKQPRPKADERRQFANFLTGHSS